MHKVAEWVLTIVFTVPGHPLKTLEVHGLNSEPLCRQEGWKLHDEKIREGARGALFSCRREDQPSESRDART